jgi:Helix-turn-helix domain of resolvase
LDADRESSTYSTFKLRHLPGSDPSQFFCLRLAPAGPATRARVAANSGERGWRWLAKNLLPGIAKAKAENRYMGRRPSARLEADEAVKLFKAGRSVTDIATALNIGRGSVYRALEAAGMKSASGWT